MSQVASRKILRLATCDLRYDDCKVLMNLLLVRFQRSDRGLGIGGEESYAQSPIANPKSLA